MIGLDETALWDLMNGLRQQPIQIGWLHPGFMRAIGSTTPIVLLSLYTIDQFALGRHPQRYYEILRFTPDIIYHGECRRIAENRLAFVHAHSAEPDKPYRAVVKAVGGGKEVFLESSYRIQRAQARKHLSKKPAISRW